MRFLVVLVTVSCAIAYPQTIISKLSNVVDCRILNRFMDVDMKTMFGHKLPKTYIEKCLAACLGEIAGIIKNRKIDPDGVAALANKSYNGDIFKVEIAREIANACLDVTDGDRCQAAVKIFECMHKDAQSKGISHDDL